MRIVVTPTSSAASVAAFRSGAPTPPPAPWPSTSTATGTEASFRCARAGPCGVSSSIIALHITAFPALGRLLRDSSPGHDPQPALLARGDGLDPAGNLDVRQDEARPRDVRHISL